MISSMNINLKVPFNEKDQAKSLGARWNAELKAWYVPIGVSAAPFEKWFLSSSNSHSNLAPSQTAIKQADKLKAQNNIDANMTINDDMDDINARLRDAYESAQDAF